MAPDPDDYYCMRVRRFGAASIEEMDVHEHALQREAIEAMVLGQLATLCPGDRAEITLTRGVQKAGARSRKYRDSST